MAPGIDDITVETELAELRQALKALVEAADKFNDHEGCTPDCGVKDLAAAIARAREVLSG